MPEDAFEILTEVQMTLILCHGTSHIGRFLGLLMRMSEELEDISRYVHSDQR